MNEKILYNFYKFNPNSIESQRPIYDNENWDRNTHERLPTEPRLRSHDNDNNRNTNARLSTEFHCRKRDNENNDRAVPKQYDIGTAITKTIRMSETERQLFLDILFEWEGAVAFDDSDVGLLNPAIEPPILIHTIPHVVWQQQNFRLPKAMQQEATRQVKEKLGNSTVEFSQDPYQGRYFLVEKKAKDR